MFLIFGCVGRGIETITPQVLHSMLWTVTLCVAGEDFHRSWNHFMRRSEFSA